MLVKCQYKFLTRLIFLFSGSSCYLLTSERDEDNPFKQSNNFHFVFVNERRFKAFKRTANNPRRFDKPWQLMTGYGNIANTKLCSASRSRMTFELGFTEQIPKILEDNSEHFQAFRGTLFESERAKKSPEIYFRPKSFRTIFEKRTPVYSFAAPLLGLAKSIY